MKINHYEEIESNEVDMEGASGCQVRQLINVKDGAPTFAMRQFEVSPGGHTPRHSHDYEHEIFVIEGEGVAYEGNQAHSIKPGVTILVKPDEVHQFKNTGETPLKFLCLIPNSATGKQVTVIPECGLEE